MKILEGVLCFELIAVIVAGLITQLMFTLLGFREQIRWFCNLFLRLYNIGRIVLLYSVGSLFCACQNELGKLLMFAQNIFFHFLLLLFN